MSTATPHVTTDDSRPTWEQVDPKKMAKLRRMLCATVLTMEALVLFFAALVAMRLADVPGPLLWWGTAVLVLGCVVLAGLQGRAWGVQAGSVWQGVVLVCAVVVPDLAILAAVFMGLWVASLLVVRRIAGTPVPTQPPT